MIPRELPAALVRHALHVSRLTVRPECDATCSELRRVKPIASKRNMASQTVSGEQNEPINLSSCTVDRMAVDVGRLPSSACPYSSAALSADNAALGFSTS